jgi:hypothetical protein
VLATLYVGDAGCGDTVGVCAAVKGLVCVTIDAFFSLSLPRETEPERRLGFYM